MPVIAEDVKRPNANNKSNITKKNDAESGRSLIKRLMSDYDGNESVMKQIRMLSDLRNDGVLTEEEFTQKKKYLLNKIK